MAVASALNTLFAGCFITLGSAYDFVIPGIGRTVNLESELQAQKCSSHIYEFYAHERRAKELPHECNAELSRKVWANVKKGYDALPKKRDLGTSYEDCLAKAPHDAAQRELCGRLLNSIYYCSSCELTTCITDHINKKVSDVMCDTVPQQLCRSELPSGNCIYSVGTTEYPYNQSLVETCSEHRCYAASGAAKLSTSAALIFGTFFVLSWC